VQAEKNTAAATKVIFVTPLLTSHFQQKCLL